MQVELLNDQGIASSKVDVPDTVFGREYNESLIHQVVVAFQANARSATTNPSASVAQSTASFSRAAMVGVTFILNKKVPVAHVLV